MSIGRKNWQHKLGKKPARPEAIKFALASYVNLELPKPPASFRHRDPPEWNDFGNSQYGNCVLAGAANETSLWEHEGGKPTPPFTTSDVVSDYSAVTGFDPARADETDQGSDMGEVAEYRRATGIVDSLGQRHKIDAYARVKLKSMQHLRAAIWILGGVGLGFIFPDYAMKQFKAGVPWSVRSGWSFPKWVPEFISGDEGPAGHYVPAVGIAANGNIICVSWGREQEMAPEFYLKYADEVVAYLDIDRLKERISPEGFDEKRLRRDMVAVASGRVHSIKGWVTQVA